MSDKLNGNSMHCPHCKANLISGEIPEDTRHMFGGKKHFLRVIGVVNRDGDRVESWQCPDCGAEESA